MELDRFKALVQRLEQESAVAPGAYRAKVAGLALLGFGILALLLGTVGLGLLLLAGFALAVAFSGGTALLLLLKLGKLLLFIAIPMWFLVKSALQALFIRLPAPQGRELTRDQAPALFAALDGMRARMKGPHFHHVLVVDEVNAAVVQRPAFGLIGWPRNYLLLGLPLLEALAPEEALAVVAHEYGHLAGSHGRFSAFIYRLRHTWGTVQAWTDQVQGWLGRLVAPLVRWYAPYFNAYTFVLARSDEYLADAAAAELVGTDHAAHALKRTNLVAPRHQRFMAQTFERIAHEPAPPGDLAHRWAAQAAQPPEETDARRWLVDALDREGQVTDTHPTLRARLQALPPGAEALQEPPPPLAGASAASAWLGAGLEPLRQAFAQRWAEQVAEPWSERHAEARRAREELARLRALATPDVNQQIATLRLALQLEPETDWRDALAAFNAAQPDHALGLFLEGTARLDREDASGLPLLDRAMALDPEAIKPACDRAYGFLQARQDSAAAEAYAERWRERDRFEAERTLQIENLEAARDTLVAHGLDAAQLQAVRERLVGPALKSVAEVWLARRVIPADPELVQIVMGLRLTWWGRRRGHQHVVINRLARLEWPVGLVFFTLDGRYAAFRKKFQALPEARIR